MIHSLPQCYRSGHFLVAGCVSIALFLGWFVFADAVYAQGRGPICPDYMAEQGACGDYYVEGGAFSDDAGYGDDGSSGMNGGGRGDNQITETMNPPRTFGEWLSDTLSGPVEYVRGFFGGDTESDFTMNAYDPLPPPGMGSLGSGDVPPPPTQGDERFMEVNTTDPSGGGDPYNDGTMIPDNTSSQPANQESGLAPVEDRSFPSSPTEEPTFWDSVRSFFGFEPEPRASVDTLSDSTIAVETVQGLYGYTYTIATESSQADGSRTVQVTTTSPEGDQSIQVMKFYDVDSNGILNFEVQSDGKTLQGHGFVDPISGAVVAYVEDESGRTVYGNITKTWITSDTQTKPSLPSWEQEFWDNLIKDAIRANQSEGESVDVSRTETPSLLDGSLPQENLSDNESSQDPAQIDLPSEESSLVDTVLGWLGFDNEPAPTLAPVETRDIPRDSSGADAYDPPADPTRNAYDPPPPGMGSLGSGDVPPPPSQGDERFMEVNTTDPSGGGDPYNDGTMILDNTPYDYGAGDGPSTGGGGGGADGQAPEPASGATGGGGEAPAPSSGGSGPSPSPDEGDGEEEEESAVGSLFYNSDPLKDIARYFSDLWGRMMQ